MPTLSKNSAVSWRRIYLLPIGTTGGFYDDGGKMTRRQKRRQPPRIARGLVLPNRPNPKTRPSRGDGKNPKYSLCGVQRDVLFTVPVRGRAGRGVDRCSKGGAPHPLGSPNYSLLCGCRFRGDGDGRRAAIHEWLPWYSARLRKTARRFGRGAQNAEHPLTVGGI